MWRTEDRYIDFCTHNPRRNEQKKYRRRQGLKAAHQRMKIRETGYRPSRKVPISNLSPAKGIWMLVDRVVQKELRRLSTMLHRPRGLRRVKRKMFKISKEVEYNLRNWNSKSYSKHTNKKWTHLSKWLSALYSNAIFCSPLSFSYNVIFLSSFYDKSSVFIGYCRSHADRNRLSLGNSRRRFLVLETCKSILKQLDNSPSFSMSDRLRLVDYLFIENSGSLCNC